jgi:hypothetical protein
MEPFQHSHVSWMSVRSPAHDAESTGAHHQCRVPPHALLQGMSLQSIASWFSSHVQLRLFELHVESSGHVEIPSGQSTAVDRDSQN